jgi:lipid II:glycine glycyltransferase (peptidoglycan interpeptide bridge formation enzyme)
VSIGYVPRGPVIDGDASAVWPELRGALDETARRHRAICLIVEPDGAVGLTGSYREAGFVRGPTHFQPGRTVKVPLVDDDALLAQMHQKTRYSVRLAQRRGVVVERVTPDVAAMDGFYGLLEETSKRNAFQVHSRAYYDDFVAVFAERVVLLRALVEENHAATLISAAFGDEAIYMYGASSTQHRAHGAAFLLQFEAMRWAREQGCTRYDLWGIPDEDPETISGEGGKVASTHGDDWRGLFRFKTGFGGEIVRYPPSMERRYWHLLAWLARRTGVLRG